jgi:hypothetical protein
MLIWHILAHCVPCVHLMKLLCTQFDIYYLSEDNINFYKITKFFQNRPNNGIGTFKAQK